MRRLFHSLVFAFALTAAGSAQEFITISLSGGSVNWTNATGNSLIPGQATNPGSNTITISSSWDLQPGRTALVLYGYFSSSTAALAHQSAVCTTGCLDIPASAVEIRVNGGALTPCNSSGPFGAAGSSAQVFNLRITGANKIGNRTDVVAFNINLASLPQLPADSYAGTLSLQAQATP
jgi:hypothetical protein